MKRADLERAIEANPGDESNYLVFADWLTQQGDPRGELISVQHAISRRDAPDLRAREAEILREHATELLGALPQEWFRVTWRLGFFESLYVSDTNLTDFARVVSQIERILESPSARFLGELRIGLMGWMLESQVNIPSLLEMLGTLPAAKRITRLAVGDSDRDIDNAHRAVGSMAIVKSAFPRVQALEIVAGHFSLGELPPLRELEIETCALHRADLAHILAIRQSLETLLLCTGTTEHATQGDITLDDLNDLLLADFPRLTALGIKNCELTDEVIPLLLRSRLLPKLRVLDFSLGTLSDQGAALLAADAQKLAHLERIDVARNALTKKGAEMLRRIGPTITGADDQKGQRYVSIWE